MEGGGIVIAFAAGILVGLLGAYLFNLAVKNRRKHVDRQMGTLAVQLDELRKLVTETEGRRQEQYGALAHQLDTLTTTTSKLRSTLDNEHLRGTWGEQIAEGILQSVGFVAGVHYVMQSSISDGDSGKIRPDFTFYLPNNLNIHMDVKFPFKNYEQYFAADLISPAARKQYLRQFTDDTKKTIDQTSRYISTDTLDCALMFIPNESLFHFLSDVDEVRAYALKHRVVICSPMSLLVVLAIIRQACEAFALEKSLGKIRALAKDLIEEMSKYTTEFATLETQLQAMQETLSGLQTTRVRKLKKNTERLQIMIEQSGAADNIDFEN